MQSLDRIWSSDQPHLDIEDIRDWFASYVYLPRLRDEATLNSALQRLMEKNMADPFAYAIGSDEETGAYEGGLGGRALMLGSLERGLLVRRDAIPREKTKPEPILPGEEADSPPDPTPPGPGGRVSGRPTFLRGRPWSWVTAPQARRGGCRGGRGRGTGGFGPSRTRSRCRSRKWSSPRLRCGSRIPRARQGKRLHPVGNHRLGEAEGRLLMARRRHPGTTTPLGI